MDYVLVLLMFFGIIYFLLYIRKTQKKKGGLLEKEVDMKKNISDDDPIIIGKRYEFNNNNTDNKGRYFNSPRHLKFLYRILCFPVTSLCMIGIFIAPLTLIILNFFVFPHLLNKKIEEFESTNSKFFNNQQLIKNGFYKTGDTIKINLPYKTIHGYHIIKNAKIISRDTNNQWSPIDIVVSENKFGRDLYFNAGHFGSRKKPSDYYKKCGEISFKIPISNKLKGNSIHFKVSLNFIYPKLFKKNPNDAYKWEIGKMHFNNNFEIKILSDDLVAEKSLTEQSASLYIQDLKRTYNLPLFALILPCVIFLILSVFSVNKYIFNVKKFRNNLAITIFSIYFFVHLLIFLVAGIIPFYKTNIFYILWIVLSAIAFSFVIAYIELYE